MAAIDLAEFPYAGVLDVDFCLAAVFGLLTRGGFGVAADVAAFGCRFVWALRGVGC